MQFIPEASFFIDFNITHEKMEIVSTYNKKFLGLVADHTFSWNTHIDVIVPKLSSVCYAISTTKPFLSQESLKMLYYYYYLFIIPILYCIEFIQRSKHP
jgi:hypothetical protein